MHRRRVSLHFVKEGKKRGFAEKAHILESNADARIDLQRIDWKVVFFEVAF